MIFPLALFGKRPASTVVRGPRGNLHAFFDALSAVADRVENLSFRFGDPHDPDGFVQIWGAADHWLQIHRLWARYPHRGDGSRILRIVCELADEHDIGVRLKVIPIGRRPYPLERPRLKSWYERFGFEGKAWKLQRLPRVQEQVGIAGTISCREMPRVPSAGSPVAGGMPGDDRAFRVGPVRYQRPVARLPARIEDQYI